jgi:hypothetical protein
MGGSRLKGPLDPVTIQDACQSLNDWMAAHIRVPVPDSFDADSIPIVSFEIKVHTGST